MSELEVDSNASKVLDCAARGIEITVSENESGPRTCKTPESVGRQDSESQHKVLPVAENMHLTADFELTESDNASGNFYIEDSSIGEPGTKCPSILSAAGRLSSSEPHNLPQPVMDISAETSSMQLDLPSELSHFEQCSNDICQLEPSESLPQPHDLPQPLEDIGICQLEPSESSRPLSLPQPVEDIGVCQLEPSGPLSLPQPIEDIGICQLEPSESSRLLSLPQSVEDIGVCQLEPSESFKQPHDLPQPVEDIGVCQLEPSESFQQPHDLPQPVEDIGICQLEPLYSSQTLSLPQPIEDIDICQLEPSESLSQSLDLPQPIEDIGVCQSELSESFKQPHDLPQPVEDIGICQLLELSKSSSLSPDLPQSVVDISIYESQLPKSSLKQLDLPKPVEDVSICQSQPSKPSLQPADLPQSVVDIGTCESQLSESSSHQPDLPQPVVDISTATSSLQLDDCGAVSKSPSSMSQSEQCSSDVCQSETVVLEQQEDASEGCFESSVMVVHQQPVDHIEVDAETDGSDKPSTVIVISTRRNKDELSTSCQPDMDCASTDVAENDTRCETGDVPQSMSDSYMCCSDEPVQATKSTDNLPSYKHTESVDCSDAVSKNETEMISDDTSSIKPVVRRRPKSTYGMRLA